MATLGRNKNEELHGADRVPGAHPTPTRTLPTAPPRPGDPQPQVPRRPATPITACRTYETSDF